LLGGGCGRKPEGQQRKGGIHGIVFRGEERIKREDREKKEALGLLLKTEERWALKGKERG